MYQNYIFDLYGTLVDIHTNEKKAYLWKKMSLFFGMKGAAYEPKELRMAYETKIKEQEAALKMECRGSHVPEIDIADVFRQLFEDQAVSVTEKEIADLAKMFRAISIEELKDVYKRQDRTSMCWPPSSIRCKSMRPAKLQRCRS